jgi:peptidoglycan/LPS O-acetylase OafA/YrhL
MTLQNVGRKFFADITHVPDVLKNNHLPSLDGLRGLSILVVLIAHFNQHLHEPIMGVVFGNGVFGVYIFFVISGFLITTLLLKEKVKTGTISLRKFYIRRFLRIFPLAYLFIAVILILNSIYDLEIPSSAFFIAGLYLVNFFHFFSATYYFNHYWSLSVEEQFYIFIPPFIKYKFDLYRYSLFFLLAFTFCFRFIYEANQSVFISKFVFDLTRSLDGLLIGSLFSILVFTDLIPWNVIKKHKILLNIILIILIILCKNDTSNFALKLFYNHTFYSLLIGLLIVSNIYLSNDFIFRILNSRVLSQIGIVSYSIYIWQQVFTSALFMNYYPYNIVFIFIAGFASYYLYERFFLRLKEKFKSKKVVRLNLESEKSSMLVNQTLE